MKPPRADMGAFWIAFLFGFLLATAIFLGITNSPEEHAQEAIGEYIYQIRNS